MPALLALSLSRGTAAGAVVTSRFSSGRESIPLPRRSRALPPPLPPPAPGVAQRGAVHPPLPGPRGLQGPGEPLPQGALLVLAGAKGGGTGPFVRVRLLGRVGEEIPVGVEEGKGEQV